MAMQLLERPSLPEMPEGDATGAELVRFYRGLALLDDRSRLDALREALGRESSAGAAERRLRVMSRLRACAEMRTDDARRFTRSYETLFDELPERERRAIEEAERDAALHGLQMREYERVRDLVPSLQEWQAPPRPQSPYFDRLTAVLAALEMDLAMS